MADRPPDRPTDYQGNSHKDRERAEKLKEKVVDKVITGEVIKPKRTLGQKFKGIFFGGEFKGAAKYIAADVLFPALRNLLVDTTTKGVERVVYGESEARRRRPTPGYGSRTQYYSPVMRQNRPYLPDQMPRGMRQVRRETNDFVLAQREEAELVLERLMDIIDKYEVASLADLHQLVGLPSTHVDNKWGWSYLSNIEIRQVRDGYMLELPPPEEI